MAVRKGWEALKPSYRERLQKKGVSQQDYESGASLAPGRGHGSKAKENERKKFLRSRDKYVKMTAKMLGRDVDEQHEHFMLYTEDEQMKIMEAQEEAYTLYCSGDHQGATNAFIVLQNDIGYLPYWLIPYRGKKFPS